MVQCGGAGVNLSLNKPARLFKLIQIEKATFHRVVLPEECLHFEIKTICSDGNLINQSGYLQPIITQYFIDNKSEIWLLFLIAHSKR